MIHKASLKKCLSALPLTFRASFQILPACNHQQIPFAYKMYTRADEIGWKQSNAFKQAFSVDVPIEFIGVWYVTASTVLSRCRSRL
jgi:hypothetical protein